MAYTTQQAIETLNGYLNIRDDQKSVIADTKNRGYVVDLNSGEQVVIFIYPLVHKQDNTKNYFDTRDSGPHERAIAWEYALKNKYKYFCTFALAIQNDCHYIAEWSSGSSLGS